MFQVSNWVWESTDPNFWTQYLKTLNRICRLNKGKYGKLNTRIKLLFVLQSVSESLEFLVKNMISFRISYSETWHGIYAPNIFQSWLAWDSNFIADLKRHFTYFRRGPTLHSCRHSKSGKLPVLVDLI